MRLSRLLTVVLALVVAGAGFAALSARAQGDDGPGLVVYASNRTGNYEIYLLDPATGLGTQLTNDAANDIEPVWSPDASLIAFASNRDGDYELFIMRADGTSVRQLTNNLAEDRQPRWQPGGAHLVFVSNVNGQFDLYTVSADGAIVRQLTNDPADERGPSASTGAGGLPVVPTPGVVITTIPSVTADAFVINATLNLRENPGEGARILEVMPQNTPLDIIGRYIDNSWVQVRVPSSKIGWVRADLVDINIDLTTVPVVNAIFIAPPPTATPTPAATATPTVFISFWSNKAEITVGQCATVGWDVEGIKEVYFEDKGVVGHSSREVCPTVTTTYHLRVILVDLSVVDRYVTIVVKP
jgi:hypothetical protein